MAILLCILCVSLSDSTVYKNPIRHAFAEYSEYRHLPAISDMKMALSGKHDLIFGCRTVQERFRYKVCLSSMLSS